MARKKTVVTTEEVDVPDEYADVHDKPMAEVIADASKPPVEEENQIEKKAKEIEEQPKKEEEPEIDADKLKQEIADETSQKIVDALQGKDAKETKDNVDEYEEWAKKVFDDTGKAPNWKQAAEFIKDVTKRELKAEQEAVQKEEATKKEAVAVQEKKAADDWNSFIDRELEELYTEGKLPRIKDDKNENDPGMVARKALFQAMLDTNTALAAEGKPIEYSIYKIFHQKYKAPNKQPAGADAPVAGGAKIATPEEDKVNYYRDVKKSWYDLLHGK